MLKSCPLKKFMCLMLRHSAITTTQKRIFNDYLVVIPWARVVCLIYTLEARGPQARGLRVYISGKPRVHMV